MNQLRPSWISNLPIRRISLAWAALSVLVVALAASALAASAQAASAQAAPRDPQAIDAETIWDGTYVNDRVARIGASPALNDLARSLSPEPTSPDEPTPAGPEASFEATYHRVENSGHIVFVVIQTFADRDALNAYWQAYATEDWTVSEDNGDPVFTYLKQYEDGSGYRNKTMHIGRYVLAAKQMHAGDDYLAAFAAYREQVENFE